MQNWKVQKEKKKTLCSCLNVLLVCLTGLWWHTGQGWRFQTPPLCPSPLRVDRPVGRRLRSPACSPGRNAERVEMVSGGNNLRQTTTATKKKTKTFYSSRLSGMLRSVNCHIYALFIKYSSASGCVVYTKKCHTKCKLTFKGNIRAFLIFSGLALI